MMRLVRAAALAAVLLSQTLSGSSRVLADDPKSAPRTVEVCKPIIRTITEYANFAGQISAGQKVDLKAVARGHLVKILFQDGQSVKQGDLLFEIDPRTYQAALDLADAQMKVA